MTLRSHADRWLQKNYQFCVGQTIVDFFYRKKVWVLRSHPKTPDPSSQVSVILRTPQTPLLSIQVRSNKPFHWRVQPRILRGRIRFQFLLVRFKGSRVPALQVFGWEFCYPNFFIICLKFKMEIDVIWGLPKPLTMGKKSILIFYDGNHISLHDIHWFSSV